MYTVVGKTGVRPTTLRDARTKDLVPSVTTILNVAAKPALIAWMQKQVLMSALTMQRIGDEPDAAYMDRILVDSRELAKAAADAVNSAVQAWEDLMWKFQQPLPGSKPGAKWIPMDIIFDLKDC